MTRTVRRALLTTAAVLLFVAGFGPMSPLDVAVSAFILYPFAHLFCRHVVGD